MDSIRCTLGLSIAIYCVCVQCLMSSASCHETQKKTITLDLKSTHNGKLFYSELTIGHETNKRTFNMLIATSYHLTWLASINMSPSGGYMNRSVDEYDPTQHYTGITGAVYGGSIFHLHYDTFQVGTKTIHRQPFALMYYHHGRKRTMVPNIDGIIGLNEGIGWPENVDYLFANLYNHNYIDSLMYSLYINNTAVANRLNNSNKDETDQQQQQQQQPEGALVLGGVDTKYYTGDFVYVPMFECKDRSSSSNVSLNISHIHLDWNRLDKDQLIDSIARLGIFQVDQKPTRLKLDSSLIVFFGDRKTLDLIHLRILGANPILRVMHGFEIRITPEEYVIKHELNNRTLCLSAFKPYNEDVWSFGTTFLRKYYTVFDYQNNRVGFAKAN